MRDKALTCRSMLRIRAGEDPTGANRTKKNYRVPNLER